MFFKRFPWKFLVKRAARRFGTIDPVDVLARLRAFSQPSEIQEPFELLRAGIVFHARGLVNTKAIQHNLDWVWPYWVEKQFNPADPSFIPRGFSFSHINLTHRNWTAVGLPSLAIYPIVDPRGLVTPLLDGWSLDCWIVGVEGKLLPSRLESVEQQYVLEGGLAVRTVCRNQGMELCSVVSLEVRDAEPLLKLAIEAKAAGAATLVVALRPYNPEGIQFIERIALAGAGRTRLLVDEKTEILFSEPVEKLLLSTYRRGDVFHALSEEEREKEIYCKTGMATGAAVFRLDAGIARNLTVSIPLQHEQEELGGRSEYRIEGWSTALRGASRLRLPDKRLVFLYDAAVRTLVLLSGHDVFPGPYTYRRFWFRDACLMLHALLTIGLADRCQRCMALFSKRQKSSGYYHSQEGEWDSNGQVLWFYERYRQLSGEKFDDSLLESIRKGANWIISKRVKELGDPLTDGLLPPGFSAEHFGPNDYYYWDDFWAVAGLRSAASIFAAAGEEARTRRLGEKAEVMLAAVFRSIAAIEPSRRGQAIPASPHRRLDAGAIGSLVADYPLQLTGPGDAAIMNTVFFLLDHCRQRGGFFQDIVHSGINPYLTLAMAQTLLRAGDPRYLQLIEAVADLASPTGQWPEAIHPRTGGGCMGDGQHGWAAAEWVMLMRNLFVREEGDGLVIGSGVQKDWLSEEGEPIGFGPTLTPWGAIEVYFKRQGGKLQVWWTADWRGLPPKMDFKVPGFRPYTLETMAKPEQTVVLEAQ
ncbi:MAG: hypothetical protein P8130_08955 [Deltaproteobacteria bacterium]